MHAVIPFKCVKYITLYWKRNEKFDFEWNDLESKTTFQLYTHNAIFRVYGLYIDENSIALATRWNASHISKREKKHNKQMHVQTMGHHILIQQQYLLLLALTWILRLCSTVRCAASKTIMPYDNYFLCVYTNGITKCCLIRRLYRFERIPIWSF